MLKYETAHFYQKIRDNSDTLKSKVPSEIATAILEEVNLQTYHIEFWKSEHGDYLQNGSTDDGYLKTNQIADYIGQFLHPMILDEWKNTK